MRLRLATFNVLAIAYLDYGTYSPQALEFLRSERRIPALLKLLRGIQADVIALQEVERDLMEALKSDSTWDVFGVNKTGGKPDGLALLVRRTVRVVKGGHYGFHDGTDHVWQWIQVGDIFIVNIHLKYSPEDAAVHDGVRQMSDVLGWLAGRPAVIMGDCNGRPGGRVRKTLEIGGFVNAWGGIPTALIIQDGVAEEAPIDLIAVRGGTTELSMVLRSVVGIPCEDNPSDHVPVIVGVRYL